MKHAAHSPATLCHRSHRPALRALVLALGVLMAGRLPSAAAELVVMTYNLRYASTNRPNAWPDRRPLVKEVIDKYTPDIIGTQEGVYWQLKQVAEDQPDYEWIGLGRDGGSRGEFMAVFYKRERFEPLAYDHFWLSDTPEVIGSSTWGHSNRRMVTWVRFKDRQSGEEFYFWNTHLDHENQEAREKAADLIRRRVEAIKDGLPLLLVADFNSVAGQNRVYEMLTGDQFFRDTWTLAQEKRNAEYNSFNGFNRPRKNGQRIDWILARGEATVSATEIVIYEKDGQFPSDHFPVVAWMKLGK